jgi:hypothetical protein
MHPAAMPAAIASNTNIDSFVTTDLICARSSSFVSFGSFASAFHNSAGPLIAVVSNGTLMALGLAAERSSRATSTTKATPPSGRIVDPEIPGTDRNSRPSGLITVCRSP